MNAVPSLLLSCPHCASMNRVPRDRLAQAPRCGRCHEALFTGAPFALTTATFDVHASRSEVPLLRGLDGVEALALEHGRKPFGSSPIHDVRDPYAALLACEMTRHPRLGALLDDTMQAIDAVASRERTRSQGGALHLIPRIRERSKAWI